MLSDSLSSGATLNPRQPPADSRTIDGRRADAIEPVAHAVGETVSVAVFNQLVDRFNALLAAVRSGTGVGTRRLSP